MTDLSGFRGGFCGRSQLAPTRATLGYCIWFLSFWCLSVVGVTGNLAMAAGDAAKGTLQGQIKTRQIMDTIFEPLSKVLPLSFNENDFTSAKNRAQITSSLKDLSEHANVLEKHAENKGRSFEFVAKSLERDAKNLYRWYTKGQYDEARFTLHNMTENCIACHSALPENTRFPPAEKFFAAIKLKDLPPLERAHIQVLSRQFDDAIGTYEEVLRSKEIHPLNLIVLGAFTDYLKLCISVKNDLKRPQALMKEIMDRPVTPLHVKEQLKKWLVTLQKFDQEGILQKTDLESARKTITDGRSIMEFPRDRDGLVHYLVGSAILNRFVYKQPDRGAQVAEAYYWLGVSESLLEHSLWIQRSEFYFESAIRLAPAADFAPKAYTLLEDSYISGYTGSSGTHVPDDIRELLAELRRIIEQARGKKS